MIFSTVHRANWRFRPVFIMAKEVISLIKILLGILRYTMYKVLRRSLLDLHELHTRTRKRPKLRDFSTQSGSGQQKRILVSSNIVNLDLSSCFPTRIKYDHRALKITRTGKSPAPKFSGLEMVPDVRFIRQVVTKSYI